MQPIEIFSPDELTIASHRLLSPTRNQQIQEALEIMQTLLGEMQATVTLFESRVHGYRVKAGEVSDTAEQAEHLRGLYSGWSDMSHRAADTFGPIQRKLDAQVKKLSAVLDH